MKKIILLITIIFLAITTYGCKQQNKKIVIWGTSAILGTDEAELPQNEWMFTKLLNEYTEMTGIEFEVNLVADEAELQLSIRAHSMAGTGPDIVNLWTGPYVSNLEDVLLPLNDYVSKDDLENIKGWDVVTNDLMIPSGSNKILGYPFGGDEVCLLMYNKSIIKKAGLDFENNPPKTVEEFDNALAKIKSIGELPIIASYWDANCLINYVFSKWWVQMDGPSKIIEMANGNESFNTSDAFKNTFKKLNYYYEQGYINQDYLTFETADVSFYSGNGAIYPTGNWDFDLAYEMLGEDLGIFEIPDYDQNCLIPNYLVGGNGQSMCVLKNTKYPKECADFLSWLSNKENTIKYGKHKSVLPLRRDITLEEYGYGDTDLHKKIYEMSLRTSIWHEYYMSPELADYYYIFGASTIIGNISLDEFVKKMDEKAKELSKNEKN